MEAGLALLYEKIGGENATGTLRAKIEWRLKGKIISTGEMEKRVTAIVGRNRQLTSFAAERDPESCPAHPGALLRDEMFSAIGKPAPETANLLGISQQHLDEILREESLVSAALAVRFGKMFGNDPLMWIRMQAGYDTWHAVRDIDVSGVPVLRG